MSLPSISIVVGSLIPKTLNIRVGSGPNQLTFPLDSALLCHRSSVFNAALHLSTATLTPVVTSDLFEGVTLASTDPTVFEYYFQALTTNNVDSAPLISLSNREKQAMFTSLMNMARDFNDITSATIIARLGDDLFRDPDSHAAPVATINMGHTVPETVEIKVGRSPYDRTFTVNTTILSRRSKLFDAIIRSRNSTLSQIGHSVLFRGITIENKDPTTFGYYIEALTTDDIHGGKFEGLSTSIVLLLLRNAIDLAVVFGDMVSASAISDSLVHLCNTAE